MVHLEHNRVKNPTGGNQLARYKREEGFELDKTEKQYMQQWLEWDLNWAVGFQVCHKSCLEMLSPEQETPHERILSMNTKCT